jgi:hypothetical protein
LPRNGDAVVGVLLSDAGARIDRANARRRPGSMASIDVDYYEHRAEHEIEMAQRARDTRAVQAHYELANAYLDKIYGEAEEA